VCVCVRVDMIYIYAYFFAVEKPQGKQLGASVRACKVLYGMSENSGSAI